MPAFFGVTDDGSSLRLVMMVLAANCSEAIVSLSDTLKLMKFEGEISRYCAFLDRNESTSLIIRLSWFGRLSVTDSSR